MENDGPGRAARAWARVVHAVGRMTQPGRAVVGHAEPILTGVAARVAALGGG